MSLLKTSRDRVPALFLSLALLSATCCPANCAASDQSDSSSIVLKVSTLENRFFEHPFPDETLDERLGRLENFVFGQPRQGADQQRLKNLMAAMPANAGSYKPIAKRATDPAESRPLGQTVPFIGKDLVAAAASREHDFNQPPKYLSQNNDSGQSYNYQPSPNDYGQPPNSYQPPNQNSYGSSQYQSGNSTSGLEQKVSSLETKVLGETHKYQSLPERLTALENTMLAANSSHSGSLMERADRLSDALGESFGGSPSGSAPIQGYTSRNGATTYRNEPKINNGHPVLKNAAKTALVVGAVAGATALTIMAVKGMNGGGKHGLFKKFDLD